MLYKDLIQGTDEWKEIRYRKLGGSSNSKVMTNIGKPVEDNAIFFELVGEFTEDFEFEEERFLSVDVVRGNELEPIAREEFSRIYGKKVFEIGWAESTNFTGISPDGIIGEESEINDIEDVIEAIEIKCPSKNTYIKYLKDKSVAVTDYAWQIVTYFKEFPKLETLNLFIYRPENKLKSHILIKLKRYSWISVDKKYGGIIPDLCFELDKRQTELLKAITDWIDSVKATQENKY